jgi:oligoribonuclease (3'-5' exoribonuclease)
MTDTDPEEIIESIEQQTDDDLNPLAEDVDRSIEGLAQQLDLSGDSRLGISPEQGLAMLRPMVKKKTADDPEAALRTLATLHLETGALLEKHSDTDPVELVR